jgi:hypothetical protein
MTRAQNTIAATRTIRLVVGAGRVPGHPHCYGARICLNHKENNVRYASIAQSTRHCVRPCACEWKSSTPENFKILRYSVQMAYPSHLDKHMLVCLSILTFRGVEEQRRAISKKSHTSRIPSD